MSVLLRLLIGTVYAQPTDLTPPSSCTSIFTDGTSPPGGGWVCIEEYISMLTYLLIGLAAAISMVMLMVNGLRYMTGPAVPGGSSDAAKKGITSALTGLAVSLLTYIIMDTLVFSITQ